MKIRTHQQQPNFIMFCFVLLLLCFLIIPPPPLQKGTLKKIKKATLHVQYYMYIMKYLNSITCIIVIINMSALQYIKYASM